MSQILISYMSRYRVVIIPYKTTGNIILLYVLILIFLDSKLEDKTFCTENSNNSLYLICT